MFQAVAKDLSGAKRNISCTDGRFERQRCNAMSMNPLPTNSTPYAPFSPNALRPLPAARSPSVERRSRSGGRHNEWTDWENARQSVDVVDSGVKICPSDIVRRRTIASNGIAAEIVQATRRDKIECRFRAPVHLLAVYERGVRRDGETFVEGLPRSALRDLRRKLTFVPAGHEYRDWQDPHILTRVAYFYFDPSKLAIDPELGFAEFSFAPRLFFENTALWGTALKLMSLIEHSLSANRLYFEALGAVLAHELVRLHTGAPSSVPPVRGGLAAWQQRIVLAYIEEHLADQIPLAQLAQLVRLSPHYFCRAFKQSLGMPPHRYHTSRRIERAKILLADPAHSVTDIGLTLGFSETGSFTAGFRKATGLTPTGYRSLL
jgi:AraC family transcriptional regulator